MLVGHYRFWLTEVELTVGLLIVDDVESVRFACYHVANLKIEPLMVVVSVHVRTKNQIVFCLPNLDNKGGHVLTVQSSVLPTGSETSGGGGHSKDRKSVV